MPDLASSRAARATLNAGLYESHFLLATDPAGGRAAWLRYTALKRRGGAAVSTVWLTWFDERGASEPVALRVDAEEAFRDPGDAWSVSSLGRLTSGAASGALADQAGWDLRWQACAPEVPYLPAPWLYDRPIPRANGVSLVPDALVSGTLTVGTETIGLGDWHGTVGHNWGADHAEQWSWIHAAGLGADRSGWLDLTFARVRVGPLRTPWIAGGAIRLDGRTYVPARRSRVARGVFGDRTAISFELAGGGGHLELEIEAPAGLTQTWDYAAPTGPGRTVTHCSVANATVRLSRPDTPPVAVSVAGRCAVEHGAPA